MSFHASPRRPAALLQGLSLALSVFVCCLLTERAEAAEYQLAAVPEWVKPIVMRDQVEVPEGQISNGAHYLLVNRQVQLDQRGQTLYAHYAIKALNEHGVDESSNLQLDFDPSYEQLTVHFITVRREGQTRSRLESASKTVLQRESDLESRLYDGNLTLSIAIDDVRVGDVVEYAFSVSGTNPVFEGRTSGGLSMEWSAPVAQQYASIRAPHDRDLALHVHNAEQRIESTIEGAFRRYEWLDLDIPALVVDASAPGWYRPHRALQWSEFPDWNAVARWAEPLYAVPDQHSDDLRKLVDGFQAQAGTAELRTAAALRWVQSEVRYLGIEIGAGSYRPSDPELVLKRRFGDCKDKTRLLLTMLAAMGIEAEAALVNTSRQRGLSELLPTPRAFDHVLVRARIDGRQYWLDPTLATQAGTLRTLVQPDYGLALPVSAQSDALVPMEAERPTRRRRIEAVLDSRAGLDQPVSFEITTISEAASAEAVRGQFASQSLEALGQSYLNFYASYYPGIIATAPLRMSDEPRDNRVTVVEKYQLPSFWTYVEAEKHLQAIIEAPDMAAMLRAPETPVRQAPLALLHPIEVHLNTRVLLPAPWPRADEHTLVEDPHFRFEHRASGVGEELRFSDQYVALRDHVSADAVASYVANLDKARDSLGYMLYQHDPVLDATEDASWLARVEWSVLLLTVALLGSFCALALRLYRYDPPSAGVATDSRLAGIGGWLILPAIGVVLSPLLAIRQLGESVPAYLHPTWSLLTQPGAEAYHVMWQPILLLELTALLAQAIFGGLLIVLFFGRRRSAPRVYIAYLGGVAAVLWVEYLMLKSGPEIEDLTPASVFVDAAKTTISLLIWGSYFILSKRVQATFTRTHPRNEVDPAAAAVPA